MCSLAAAEIISIKEPTDFLTPKRVVKSDDMITVKGSNFTLHSAKTLSLDPAKKYKISGDFRLKNGEGGASLYLGFTAFDADGKQIQSVNVNAKAKSDTVVAKAASSGDSVIYVKDASGWDMKTPNGYIVFNTKPDYSDLPNRDFIAVPQGNIKQNGDVWEITLKTPLTKNVAEGTGVRQQLAGAAHIYSAIKYKMPKEEWFTLSGTTAGSTSLFGTPSKELWHGTASVRVLVTMLGGKPGDVVEMKNIKVEEVE